MDITALYYTSNRIQENAGERIREHLLNVTHYWEEIPIISVSQKQIIFGTNVSIGDIGVSKYNIYKQIYIGLKYVKTPYVACCEDDVLYNYEHFLYRPEKGVFSYDCNMWFAEKDEFWRRPQLHERSGMFGYISDTETLFNFLDVKFKKYPDPDAEHYNWGEPLKDAHFYSGILPLIVFSHNVPSKSRREIQKRKLLERHKRESLPEDHVKNVMPYGEINDVWRKIWMT